MDIADKVQDMYKLVRCGVQALAVAAAVAAGTLTGCAGQDVQPAGRGARIGGPGITNQFGPGITNQFGPGDYMINGSVKYIPRMVWGQSPVNQFPEYIEGYRTGGAAFR